MLTAPTAKARGNKILKFIFFIPYPRLCLINIFFNIKIDKREKLCICHSMDISGESTYLIRGFSPPTSPSPHPPISLSEKGFRNSPSGIVSKGRLETLFVLSNKNHKLLKKKSQSKIISKNTTSIQP
jgi:hypothetical protein